MTHADTLSKSKPTANQEVAERARGSEVLRDSLERWFGAKFALLDAESSEFLAQGDLPLDLTDSHRELCREVLRRGQAEFIAEEEPVALLALPIIDRTLPQLVAVAPFVTSQSDEQTVVRSVAALGASPRAAERWAGQQPVWQGQRLLAMAELAVANLAARPESTRKSREIEELASHLADTYEEISLLYRLTQHLKISGSNEELGQLALRWLAETVPAEGFALQLLPKTDGEPESTSPTSAEHVFLTHGQLPIDGDGFSRLVELLGLETEARPIVVNPARHDGAWPMAEVRQAVVVPLTEGDNLYGWLAAINHRGEGEFGSSEASLLWSVGTILGIHAGNIQLYREQSEFLASVVRALTSAIDAKDPYTCGHSDRVARVAVRLATELGLKGRDLDTIYLSGLLHDIGKIGIDDHVLRKPGKLTEAEYEHIKLHAEIGYRILKGIKQLDQVLPVVRHHHEAWDGSGYPFKLAAEEIPYFARIVAVADAFDAMSSDRPYRKGMNDETLAKVLQEGAGQQWDRDIVEVFFNIRDEISQMVHPNTDSLETELIRMG